jgi:hypothetical protein
VARKTPWRPVIGIPDRIWRKLHNVSASPMADTSLLLRQIRGILCARPTLSLAFLCSGCPVGIAPNSLYMIFAYSEVKTIINISQNVHSIPELRIICAQYLRHRLNIGSNQWNIRKSRFLANQYNKFRHLWPCAWKVNCYPPAETR